MHLRKRPCGCSICTWMSPESFPSFLQTDPWQKKTKMARVPNAPTRCVRIGLPLPIQCRFHSIVGGYQPSPAFINPHQPSLTPKKPDPRPPVIYRLHQSGAHETATTAGHWRLSGSTAANRKLQRPPHRKTARHSRPYCGTARLGLTCVLSEGQAPSKSWLPSRTASRRLPLRRLVLYQFLPVSSVVG